MNFDMIYVTCDIKVISTDQGMKHYGGLAKKYKDFVKQQNYHDN